MSELSDQRVMTCNLSTELLDEGQLKGNYR